MAERTLLYSPLAQQDLDGIYQYISQTLRNPESAKKVVIDIIDCAENLETLPFIGNVVEGLPLEVGEYRVAGVRNYLVFYRGSDSNIVVDRILYKRRDFLPLLGLQ